MRMWWTMGTGVAAVAAVLLFSDVKVRLVYRRRLTVRLSFACFSLLVYPRIQKKQEKRTAQKRNSGKRPLPFAHKPAQKKRLSLSELSCLRHLLWHLPAFLRKHLSSLSLCVHTCALTVGCREADRTAGAFWAVHTAVTGAWAALAHLFPHAQARNCLLTPDFLHPGLRAVLDAEISVRGAQLLICLVRLLCRQRVRGLVWRKAEPVCV